MKTTDSTPKPDAQSGSEKEAANVAAIRARIDGITSLPQQHAHDNSEAISSVLARLGALTVMPDEFGEFTEEARMAVSATRSALEQLQGTKRMRESEEREREIQERAEAINQAQRAKQDSQQHKAMDAIRSMQRMATANGNANELQFGIDALAERSITEEEFGLGAPFVKLAQTCALDKLRPRYEQAVIKEAADQLRKISREEYGNLGDLADAIPEGVEPEDKLLTIIAYSHQIASALGAPAHILDVLCDPESATNEQIDAMLPLSISFDSTAFERKIAEKVKERCLKVAGRLVMNEEYLDREFQEMVDIDAIILGVKEKA